MKTRQPFIKFIFAIVSTAFLSCSHDKNDNEVVISCIPTNVSMVVNGEQQNFQAVGRGINLHQDGYALDINIDRRSLESTNEQGAYIKLPYKLTGSNLIQNFIYHQYINNVSFDGDFVVEGDFQSEVLINRETCFFATFSGTLNNGNQEIVITKGVISYTYEVPFSN